MSCIVSRQKNIYIYINFCFRKRKPVRSVNQDGPDKRPEQPLTPVGKRILNAMLFNLYFLMEFLGNPSTYSHFVCAGYWLKILKRLNQGR